MATLSNIIVSTAGFIKSSDINVTVQAYDQNLTSFANTFVLPTVDGANAQAIITDGNGTLTFGNVASSGGATAGTAYAMTLLFG